MAEEAKNYKNTAADRNGAGNLATQNTAADNNDANFLSPRTPLTPAPNNTTTTGVHDAIFQKYERVVRIPINGLVSERDFVIRTPFGEVIARGYDRKS